VPFFYNRKVYLALIALGKQITLQVKKTHDGNVKYETLKIDRKQIGNTNRQKNPITNLSI
jgi:hypothetical protein